MGHNRAYIVKSNPKEDKKYILVVEQKSVGAIRSENHFQSFFVLNEKEAKLLKETINNIIK